MHIFVLVHLENGTQSIELDYTLYSISITHVIIIQFCEEKKNVIALWFWFLEFPNIRWYNVTAECDYINSNVKQLTTTKVFSFRQASSFKSFLQTLVQTQFCRFWYLLHVSKIHKVLLLFSSAFFRLLIIQSLLLVLLILLVN